MMFPRLRASPSKQSGFALRFVLSAPSKRSSPRFERISFDLSNPIRSSSNAAKPETTDRRSQAGLRASFFTGHLPTLLT